MLKQRKKLATGCTIAIICVLMLSLLVGCTSTPKDEDKHSTDDFVAMPVLEDTRPTTPKENTITTLNGDQVTYNMNTRKIVALSGAGDLVSFGIKPSATIIDEDIKNKYPDKFEGVETLRYTQPFNAEEIMSYDPELILVYQLMDDSDIKTLSKIAPVIPLYRESFDYSERLGLIGEIFGLEDSANQLVKYAEDLKENAQNQLKELNLAGKSVTVFYYMEGISIPPTNFWYFNKIIYDDLKMTKLPIVDKFLETMDSPFTSISNEKVKDYEGDIVLYADLGFGDKPGIPDILSSNPGWLSLKAVQNDKVGVITATLFAEKDVLYLNEQYVNLISAFKHSL